ncbi:SIS domain-containing protein [Paracoccaceae bacterium]|jgi:D-sedoheptulose 7-phosphate isomerase|nr:SIS domain-containing protein [Paracoccaceae bacterium]
MSGLFFFESYADRLSEVMEITDWEIVAPLALALFDAWKDKRQVFLAGNGGSAANCNHIVNDFVYPVSKTMGKGIRMRSLSESPAVLTCLANDEGYDNIFSSQLPVFANAGDILWVMSGSGNSTNIIKVLEVAQELGLTSFAVLGFDGGRASSLADHVIHFPVNDMQVAEDLQMIVSNMIIQYLYSRRVEII